jgi:hypothetical protein
VIDPNIISDVSIQSYISPKKRIMKIKDFKYIAKESSKYVCVYKKNLENTLIIGVSGRNLYKNIHDHVKILLGIDDLSIRIIKLKYTIRRIKFIYDCPSIFITGRNEGIDIISGSSSETLKSTSYIHSFYD